jgi:succinate dehydrogenase / fumarate reductase, membrane anchor subunit
MVNRVIVGAHYGLRDWLAQRITAVIMATYVLVFVVLLVSGPKLDYAVWRALFSPQWMKFATLLFFFSLFLHAWIGVRDIVMDYVNSAAVRLAIYSLVIIALFVYAAWSVRILWGI